MQKSATNMHLHFQEVDFA